MVPACKKNRKVFQIKFASLDLSITFTIQKTKSNNLKRVKQITTKAKRT